MKAQQLDEYLAQIGFEPTPVQRRFIQRAMLDAKRQGQLIDLGERLLMFLPFLRPPAEWLTRQIERFERRRSR